LHRAPGDRGDHRTGRGDAEAAGDERQWTPFRRVVRAPRAERQFSAASKPLRSSPSQAAPVGLLRRQTAPTWLVMKLISVSIRTETSYCVQPASLWSKIA